MRFILPCFSGGGGMAHRAMTEGRPTHTLHRLPLVIPLGPPVKPEDDGAGDVLSPDDGGDAAQDGAQTRPRYPFRTLHFPIFPGIGHHMPACPCACDTLLAGRSPPSRPGAG